MPDTGVFLVGPFVVGLQVLGVVADLVLLADVGNPAVEGEDRRDVTQVARLAERAVETDLDRRTALVFRGLLGVLDTIGIGRFDLLAVAVDLPHADPVAFGKGGVQGERRHVDRDGEFLLRAFVGDTQRNVEVTRGHKLALEVLLLLLGARFVTVDELAAELQN